MGRGGSVHCGMLGILVEFSAELDTSTNFLSFLLGVHSIIKLNKSEDSSCAVSIFQ